MACSGCSDSNNAPRHADPSGALDHVGGRRSAIRRLWVCLCGGRHNQRPGLGPGNPGATQCYGPRGGPLRTARDGSPLYGRDV